MNRTITAAVALAASLGVAGLAQAQMNPSTSAPSATTPSTPMATSPGGTQPGAVQPGMSGTQNPQTMSAPGATSTYGTSPQANTTQMNQGPMNQGPQATPGMQPASQTDVLQAQQQLKSAGLYRGAIDGVMGPETQTALSKFQHAQGLPETAQLDQPTMSRLSSPNPGDQGTGARNMTPSYPTGTQNPALQNSTGNINGTTGPDTK